MAGDAAVFRARKGSASVVWYHRSPSRSNQHCLYCGIGVGEGSQITSDKEHLIGRRMAPTGLLQKPDAFNFIFRACRDCNAEKAEIEDHVSAITLLTSPGREDPEVNAVAERKAVASYDRRRRQPVGAVRNNLTISAGFLTVNLVSGAQLDRHQVKLLAFRHIQGLFSLVTSRDPTRPETTRILTPEHFGFFGAWPYRDWGNPQLIEIARRAHPVPRLAEITTADGFFRAALRREVEGGAWFWALEWNQSLRLAGWIGPHDDPPEWFVDLPAIAWRTISPDTRMRKETPLAEDAEDLLFDPVTG